MEDLLDLTERQRPECAACEQAQMERGTTYHRDLNATVRTWECPACGRVVLRGDDPEV